MFPRSKEAMFFKQRSSDMDKSMSLVDRVKDGARDFVVGIKDNTIKYARAMTEGVKSGARDLAIYGAVGAVLLTAGARVASAEPTRIMSFYDLTGISVPIKSVGMATGTNLEMLDTIPPASIVEPNSHWHMGFINYVEASPIDPNLVANVVGYAENYYSSTPGWEGRMIGNYLETIGEGKRPNDVWTVEDVDGDGIADYYPSTQALVFDEDDSFYYSEDLMFGPNKAYGDVNQLPMFVTSGSIYLPEMEVDDRLPRTGPAGMGELLDLTENWLRQDCHPYDNADCDCADWDYDGQVNFVDFSYMAQGWDPDYVTPPRTGPAGMGDLEALSENWLRQDCQLYGVNSSGGADWDFDGDVDFKDFSYMAQDWDPDYVSE